jgi:hypothetical protein
MLKFIAGYGDRAVAIYVRAHNWTPVGGGRYIDEHGMSVRRLYHPEGLWGTSAGNGKLLAVIPQDTGGTYLLGNALKAILEEAKRRSIQVEEIVQA